MPCCSEAVYVDRFAVACGLSDHEWNGRLGGRRAARRDRIGFLSDGLVFARGVRAHRSGTHSDPSIGRAWRDRSPRVSGVV